MPGPTAAIEARVAESWSLADASVATSLSCTVISNSSLASTPAETTVGRPTAAMTLGSAEADFATALMDCAVSNSTK